MTSDFLEPYTFGTTDHLNVSETFWRIVINGFDLYMWSPSTRIREWFFRIYSFVVRMVIDFRPLSGVQVVVILPSYLIRNKKVILVQSLVLL